MIAHTKILNPATDLDWRSGFIWVQLSAHLKVDRDNNGMLTFRRHNGEVFTAPRSLIEKTYFPIRNGAAMKPRYDPHKAHCLRETVDVDIEGALRTVEEGGAILQNDAGSFFTLERLEYERDYEAVAYPGVTDRPERPFPDRKPT